MTPKVSIERCYTRNSCVNLAAACFILVRKLYNLLCYTASSVWGCKNKFHSCSSLRKGWTSSWQYCNLVINHIFTILCSENQINMHILLWTCIICYKFCISLWHFFISLLFHAIISLISRFYIIQLFTFFIRCLKFFPLVLNKSDKYL